MNERPLLLPAPAFPTQPATEERGAAIAALQRSLEEVDARLVRIGTAQRWSSAAQRAFAEAVGELTLSVRRAHAHLADAAEQQFLAEHRGAWPIG